MRVLLLLIIYNLFFIIALAQKNEAKTPPGSNNPDVHEIIKRNRLQTITLDPGHQKPLTGTRTLPGSQALHGTRLDAAVFANPGKLSGYIRQQIKTGGETTLKHPNSLKPRAIVSSHPGPLTTGCSNTSFFKTVGLTNSVIYVGSITQTSDDGVLISGLFYDSTSAHPSWNDNGFLVKSDKDGNILWSTLFEDQNADRIYYINIYKIKELQNGDLIAAAYMDTTQQGGEHPVTTIYHLTPQGNITWHSELKSNLLANQTFSQWVYVNINGINEGLNGDLILSGTSIGVNSGAQAETVIRMDATGKYLWDVDFTNYGNYNLGAEGLNAYLDGGNNIIAIGVSHGSSLSAPNAINFITLDYATGNVLGKRFFTNDYANAADQFSKEFTYYNSSAIRLTNGHFLVYGILFSAFMMNTDTIDYIGVLEFDANYSLVNSYTISSLLHTIYYNNTVYFDKNAIGFFSIPNAAGPSSEDIFFASVRNDQFVRQRVAHIGNGIGTGYLTRVCFLDDGSYFLGDSYYDPARGSYFSMKKMHDTDTSSYCLGKDTLFAMKLPLRMIEKPDYYYLDKPVTGKVEPLSYMISTVGIGHAVFNPCLEKSYCELVQIQGQPVLCGITQPQLFTAIRNAGCGATVQWNIDTAVVGKLTVVNDSTVSIAFKNINWQGKLYANLQAGSCQTPISDSLGMHIISVPKAVNLGPDTSICTGNSIILHAGPAFAAYLWQDGSTDSNYTVSTAATYSVTATDYCGNRSNSSIRVVKADFPFTLGPTITKCNNDTVELKATGGFSNYRWSSSSFDETGPADSIVHVNPDQNTDYNVQAEKWVGCLVHSTVQVKVDHSPGIDLGKDTSFCFGGYKKLDAGGNFESYLWSTGQLAEWIIAEKPGIYTIKATAANGCKSYDTLTITDVYPLPEFSLGKGQDTTICDNQPLMYDFPRNGNQYQWSDGNLSSGRMIGQAGTYGLTVVSPYNCSSSHAITVFIKPAPKFNLGADTTMCTGKTLLLEASNSNANATYSWQDGSKSSDYIVSRAGMYFVDVTLNGCTGNDTISIKYTGVPEFSFGKDTVLCEGQEFVLHPLFPYPVSYKWQDGSSQDYFIIRDTGRYSLSAANICGQGTAAIYVAPGLCRLVMPSAFTPNQDGKNDLFRVKYPFTVSQFNMIIYNRWGQQVFHTQNINEGWNGTLKGAPQPAGTYIWYISLTDSHHVNETGKGTVLLIR
ncbi:gliding motility-associated C-terminal domain-containing protein [Flavitalea flava]